MGKAARKLRRAMESARFGKSRRALPVRSRTEVFTTNLPRALTRRDALSWPVVRAYQPVPDIWRASGLGTAGIVRRRPDGLCASSFFMFDLHDGGLKGMFGKPDGEEEEHDRLLKDADDFAPPCEEAPAEAAARWAWGMRAYSERQGHPFPEQFEDAFFDLLPPPPGSEDEWIDSLVGLGGPTHGDLLDVIRANPIPSDLPEGAGVAIITEMTFRPGGPIPALAGRTDLGADFTFRGLDDGREVFDWLPPWRADICRRNGMRSDGVVIIGDDMVFATTYTLSLTARLIDALRRRIGTSLRLVHVEWTGRDRRRG